MEQRMMFFVDESLQSFLFRHIQINGGLDFSCVIDDSGSWLSKPSVPEKYQHIFRMFDERLLLGIARQSGLATEPDCLFANPTSSVITLSKIFAGESHEKYSVSGIQIAFCKKCIESSLAENGFAYFKTNWLFKSYCNQHSVRLSILKHRRRGGAVKAVKELLSGGLPPNSDLFRKQYEQGKYWQLNISASQSQENKVHYMPCVVPFLLCWLQENLEVLTSNHKLRKRYWMTNLAVLGELLPHELDKICTEIKREEPNLFNAFIRNNFTRRAINFGVWRTDSFLSEVYKVKGKSCTQCSESSMLGICPMSPALQPKCTALSIDDESIVSCGIRYTHKVEIGKCKVSY